MPISLSFSFVYSLTPDFFCLISSSFLIVSIVLLFLGYSLFHHLQFLSNFLQYSLSYLLFNYSNNFLIINLSGNFSLLNASFFSFLLVYFFYVLLTFLFKFLNCFLCIFQILPSFPSIWFCHESITKGHLLICDGGFDTWIV